MSTELIHRARELRQCQTYAESLLWDVLRAKRLCQLKFRRQHPVKPFVADFACCQENLIVEIDGGYHDFQYDGDLDRTRYLESKGWRVVRFANEDVIEDVEAVAFSIARGLGLNAEFGKRLKVCSGMRVEKEASPGKPR